jgi:hypothetical protein
MIKPHEIAQVTRRWGSKDYWTKVNIIEAWAFMTKIAIIVPGLIFDKQWWWMYLFALASSLSLIITSTIKTMPTIIWFNICWVILATTAIIKHFA